MLAFHPIKVEIYGGMNMAAGKIKRGVPSISFIASRSLR